MLPMVKTILYATDLSPHAHSGFRYALSLAHQYGARVHLLHAVEPLTPQARFIAGLFAPEEKVSPGAERERWETLRKSVEARLSHLCESEPCRTEQGESVVADVLILEGKPDEVILNEAGRLSADLIVIGSHGRSTAGEFLLGSTAHRIVQKATVPVLLVRVTEGDAQEGI